jgi:ribosomal 50S subunit-recycling heat shock protein
MRLDLFLKTTRLISSRNLAQEFCDSGLVKVNGSTAKSSKEIKAGDEIEIRRRNRVVVLSVLAVPEKKQISKADAPGLYEIIREEGTESLID